MSKQQEALRLALEALESSRIFVTSREKIKHPEGTDWYDERITAIENALAQPQPEQEPVAFPRQAGDSTWTVDTAFIWRVKHTIDPDTPHDFIPSEEQIETVLLALEKIPSGIYTTPPQPKKPEQEPVYLVEDDFGLFRIADKADYTYWSGTGRHKTFIANATPPQRKPFNHHEFGYWWFEYGSGLHPLEGEDQEEHAYRVATAAWQAAHNIKE